MVPTLSIRDEATPSLVIGLVWTVAILAALFLAWPVWRAFFPLDIGFNEGWNAYHADAALGTRPLYPPPTDLSATIILLCPFI